MEINGKKTDWASRMIGKDYYVLYPSGTQRCKVLAVVDDETVTVIDEDKEETDVSIYNLRAV
jgi:hypothetical protein